MLEVSDGPWPRLLAGALIFLSGSVAAIEPPAEPPLPGFLPKAPPAFQLPPVPSQPGAPGPSGRGLRVMRVVFHGNAAIPTAELDALAAPYVGRQIGAAEIEELRQRLTRHYVERGYVNSGALLASSADGVLAYEIVEGRLVALRLRGLDDLHESYVADRLARQGDGAFNIEVLRERFQLLLGDPLFTRMNARLVPGAQPAEAILDVDIERARPYQLTLYSNNYRPPSIGSYAVGVRGWLRNLTGRGDLIEGSIEDSAKWDSGIRLSLGARAPFNSHGTAVSVQYDRGRSSVVEEPLAILGIKSVLESVDIGLSQTFVETLRVKFAMGINFIGRENSTWLLGIPFSFVPGEPEGRTRTATGRFWQEFTHRSENQALVVRSTFSFVRDNLEETPDVQSASQPDRRYALWLGQAQYARQVWENDAQVVVRATIQETRDRLLTLDGMPIGGASTVRGYRENQLIRDKARIFNAEFEWPVVRDSDRALQLSVMPFYDYGHGRNLGAPAATLSSLGVAARLRWSRLSANLAIAKRLVYPASAGATHGNLQDHGVHFDVAYNFY
jgi:hemolysin activation/secretion protein